jgi:hypothetical protein
MKHQVMYVYEFEGRTASQVGKINRELFGYKDKSNHGRYSYLRKGLLSHIPIKRLARGVVLANKANDMEVYDALRSVGAKKITKYYLAVTRVVTKRPHS